MDLLARMAIFVHVVEAGNFSTAAKQLRLSSAAVSRQIGNLEAELGGRLLRRATRRMTITPAGHRYYERCLHILREVDEANANQRRGPLAGVLQINAPVTFGLARVVPQIRPLMKSHPGLFIDLRLEDRLIDLGLEGVDVAIRVGSAPPDSATLIAHPLGSFHRVVVASPSYLKKAGEPRTPEALAKHAAIAFSTGLQAGHWALNDDSREAEVGLKAVFRSNSLHAIRELAVGGAGGALLPEWLVRDEVNRRALRVVLPTWRGERVQVTAIHRIEHRGAARIRALIGHLRSTYAAAGRTGA